MLCQWDLELRWTALAFISRRNTGPFCMGRVHLSWPAFAGFKSQGKGNLAKVMSAEDQICWPPNSINTCSGWIQTRINYPGKKSGKDLRTGLCTPLSLVCSGKAKDEKESAVKTSNCVNKREWGNTASSCAVSFPPRYGSFLCFMLTAWLPGHNSKARRQRHVSGFGYRFLSMRSSSHPEGNSLLCSMSQCWSSTGVHIQVKIFALESLCSSACGASHSHANAQPGGSFWLPNSTCNVH